MRTARPPLKQVETRSYTNYTTLFDSREWPDYADPRMTYGEWVTAWAIYG